ncbi:hypothetical protein QF036_003735 [Arthrobacter globiformis]|nr:hypothetical protein [Arthrobacter globiformis]
MFFASRRHPMEMPTAPPAEPSGGKGPDSGTGYSGASRLSERDCIRPVAASASESRQLPPAAAGPHTASGLMLRRMGIRGRPQGGSASAAWTRELPPIWQSTELGIRRERSRGLVFGDLVGAVRRWPDCHCWTPLLPPEFVPDSCLGTAPADSPPRVSRAYRQLINTGSRKLSSSFRCICCGAGWGMRGCSSRTRSSVGFRRQMATPGCFPDYLPDVGEQYCLHCRHVRVVPVLQRALKAAAVGFEPLCAGHP